MRIVLTGADGTLGHAVADWFGAAGDRVAALCGMRDADDAARGRFAVGDLADEANAAAALDKAARYLGQIDALIHLVGVFQWLKVEDSRVADWRRLFAANVETSVATVNAALPHFAPKGSIILVGAAAAQPASAGFAPYGAAKSAVSRLAEALSVELKDRGIRVNAVLPLIIDTPQNRRDMPDTDPAAWTSPEAIAEVIHFLARPESRAINGAGIPVTHAA